MPAKYILGEGVWFIGNGAVKNRIITSVKSELSGEYHSYSSQKQLDGFRYLKSLDDKESHTYSFEYSKCYASSDLNISESKIFKTKEELIASL